MECVDDRSLLIADHPHFPEIDADRRQIFCDIADVLVLGSAGQDLATDHQERGRDNPVGSGQVGGWHDHLRVFNGQTAEVRPSDQRQAPVSFGRLCKRTRGSALGRSRGGTKIPEPTNTGRGGAPVAPFYTTFVNLLPRRKTAPTF